MQKIDTKPKRRLYEVLRGQGMQANQSVVFLTDGGEDIRDLPLYLNPHSEHYLDWFHITMRLTVMSNMAKSLHPPPPDPELTPSSPFDLIAELGAQLESLKWLLWHGNTFRTEQVPDDLQVHLDTEESGPEQRKLAKYLTEFAGYIRANADRIPTTASAAAAVNPSSPHLPSRRSTRWCPSAWSKSNRCGGPRRAPICSCRSAPRFSTTLNDDLAADFARWYPGFTHQKETVELVA